MYLFVQLLASWDDYERFLEIRGEENRYPNTSFNDNQMALSGLLDDWSKQVKDHIYLLLNEGNLISATRIEDDNEESEAPVTLEELKTILETASEN